MAISPRYGDYKNCERVGSTKARVNMFQSCRRSQMKDSTCSIWKVNESKRFGTNVVTHDFHSIFRILCACQRDRFREVTGCQSTRSLEVWLAGQEHEVQYYHQRQESVLRDAWTCFFGPKMNSCNLTTRRMT